MPFNTPAELGNGTIKWREQVVREHTQEKPLEKRKT